MTAALSVNGFGSKPQKSQNDEGQGSDKGDKSPSVSSVATRTAFILEITSA